MIDFLKEENAGGIKFMAIARHDFIDWSSFPSEMNGNIVNSVQFLPGGTWEVIRFPPKIALFTEDYVESHKGFISLAKFIIPKDRSWAIAWLKARLPFRYLMLIHNYNDDEILVGSQEEPVALFMTQRTSETEPTKRNQYFTEFRCKRRELSPHYQTLGNTAFADFHSIDFFASDFLT